jgi:hypothetical protein
MNVVVEKFDDRSEQNPDGTYDYIYVGAVYSFEASDLRLRFRTYDDEPGIASLTDPIKWCPEIFDSKLFQHCTEYLRTHASVNTIHVCDPTPPGRGFIPIATAVQLAKSARLPVPVSFAQTSSSAPTTIDEHPFWRYLRTMFGG